VTPVPDHPRRPPGVFRLWLLRPLAVLLGLGVPCLVLAWGVSRLVGDRVHAVQYVFWIPTFAFAGVAWVLFAGHAAVRPFAAWRKRRSLLGRRLWIPALAGCLLLTAWWAGVDWRLHRCLPGAGPAPASGATVRLAFWNLASAPHRGFPARVEAQGADIAIISNPNFASRSPLTEELRAAVLGRSAAEPGGFLRAPSTAVASRFPILAHATVRLPPLAAEDPESGGRLVYLEFDVSRLGGVGREEPLRVLVVDMPSNPKLARREVMERAAAAARSFTGPVFRADAIGRFVADPRASVAVLDADVVVGDFNAPAASPSIRALVGDRRETFAAAGRGNPGTWRSDRPFWAIDAAFVGRGWRVVGHRVVGGPMPHPRRDGRVTHWEPHHRLLVVDVAPQP